MRALPRAWFENRDVRAFEIGGPAPARIAAIDDHGDGLVVGLPQLFDQCAELGKIRVARRQQRAQHKINVRIGEQRTKPDFMRLARPFDIDADPEVVRIGRLEPVWKDVRMEASVAGSKGASSRPFWTMRSVEITPSAPLVVAIPTRLPFGFGGMTRARNALRNSSSSSARAMPYWRNAPSRISWSEASEPVCEAEALAPSWCGPA